MGKNGHILPGRFKNPEGNWLNKYNDGGAPCPPGYVMNFAGECVPIKTKHSEEVKTYPLGYESIYDHYIGDYIKPDSGTENFLEMIDPSGFASHDDARRAYEQWQKSGNTFPSVSEALDMFSAVPALGKFAYLRYLDPNSIKAAYKQIPWQAILNLMGSEVGEDEEEKKKFGGGLNKYADGGTRPCPEGYLWDEKLQDCVKLYTDLGEYRKANQAFQDSSVLYNFQESMGGRSSNWLKSVKRNADGTVPDKAWKEYSDRAKKVPKRELDSQWKAFNNLTKRNKKEPGKKFYFRQELEGVPGGFDTYVADFEKPTQPVRYVKNPDDENVEIRNYGLILPYYPPEEPIKLNSKQVTRLQGYTTPTTLNPVSLPENLRQEISRAQDKSLSWEDTMKKYSDKYPGMEPIYQMTNNREGVGNQKLMGFTYRDYYDQENPRKFRPKEYRFEQKMGGTTGWLDQYAGGGMGGPLGLNSAQLKTISDYADKLNFQENCEDGNCRETDQIQAIYDEAQRIPGRVADFERGLLEKLWTDPVTGQEKKELQLGNPNDDARNLWKKYGAPNNFPTPSCMYVAGLGYRCFPGTKEYMSKFNTTPFNSNDQFIAAVNNGTLPFKRIDMTTDSTFDQQSKSNLRPGDIVNFKGPDMSHAMTFVGYDDKGKSDWFHSSGAPNVLYLEKDLWKDVRNPNIKKYINRFDEDRYVKEQYGDKIEQLEKQARENPTYYEKGGSTGWLDRYAGGGQGCPDGYIRNWAGQCVPANAQGMTSLTQDVNAYAREQEARAANERKMKEDAARAYNTYTTPGAAQVQVQTKQNLEKEKGYKEAKARAENTGTITKANPQVIASMEKEIDPSKITAWDYAKFYGNVLMDPLNAMKYSNEHGGRDMPIDYFSQQDYNPSLFLSALPAAGLYGAGALTNTGRTVISGANNLGRAAWQAANSPIRNIPGLTPMNLVNLGIGVNSANNLSSDINTGYYGSDAPLAEKILKGVETGLGVLGSPGMGNMLLSGARNIGRGYNTVAKRSGFSLGNSGTSTPSSFKSEIDWAKWNPETPNHPELIDEYNAIEESTKNAGTWMKNPDGSAFEGTPEQFIQQQSSWFKKAFPEGAEKTYRGTPGYMRTERLYENYPGGRGIFTGDEATAQHYTSTEGKTFDLYHPKSKNSYDIDVEGQSWRAVPIEGLPGMTSNRAPLMGKQIADTDDVATWMENSGVDYVTMRNIFDGVNAKYTRIVNNKPGNFLKSATGNVGFFDMNNPGIYNSQRSGFSLGNNRASTSSGFVDDIIDKANADNFNFYTSEANQQKLRAFRPGTTGPILPREGAPPIYSDFDPAGQEAWATFRNDVLAGKYPNLTEEQMELVSNSPLLSQALGNNAGKWFGSGNMGAVQSGLPDELRYLTGLHESTHGWSQGIGLHPTEAMILRGAYNPGMTGLPSNLSSAEKAEEALATQREVRSLLNDPLGERFYTTADAPEIRGALDKISKSGDYLKNPGAIDMNRLISSLNRIGLGALTGAGIGLGSYKLYNNSGNNEQGQSYYKKGGVKTSAEGYYNYINGYKGVSLSKGGSSKTGWLEKYK